MEDFSQILFVMLGAASGAGLVTIACLAVLQEFGPASKRDVARKAEAKKVAEVVKLASIITGPEPRSKQGTAFFTLKGPARMPGTFTEMTGTKAVFPTLMPTGPQTASPFEQLVGAHVAAPGTNGGRAQAPEPSEEEIEE